MRLLMIDQRANLITKEMRRAARGISKDIAELVHQGHNLDELIRESRLLLQRTLDELCELFLL
jgi:hypothetical protein